MKKILTTYARCGREIKSFTNNNDLKIGDRLVLLHPFCNPDCETKGAYNGSKNPISTIVGINGEVLIEHILRQQIINNAPKEFTYL